MRETLLLPLPTSRALCTGPKATRLALIKYVDTHRVLVTAEPCGVTGCCGMTGLNR